MIGMKLMVCRRTPTRLSSCFIDRNFFVIVEETVSLVLDTFL